jgi:DNA-binding GntR family transcriptional regulator
MLLALYRPAGRPLCVAHRHEELLAALRGSGAAAAAEMRRHLGEIEQSLHGTPGAAPPLRDVFAAYRPRAS